ncbi:(bacterio)chlorophyll synthase [Candidatus Chlorohelix sp.]|uniref:(bacterio)chlorophyll synthase n=1 Tax=Candidatus Chlorohelix sp. TaxID=3139201 RepID=UPI003070805B
MGSQETLAQNKPNTPRPAKSTLRGHLDLLDPVTWVAGPQGFISGAVASGGMKLDWQTLGLIIIGSILVGPLTIGFSQSINDFFDRELDAINEPTRPIPAGLVTLNGAILNFTVIALLAIFSAVLLGLLGGQNSGFIIILTILGLALGAMYSIPPFEFKRNGITGPLSVGLGYNLMTWITGNMVFGPFKTEILVVALVNAFVAAGLLVLNDLKSIEGDKKLGLRTLPVMLGVKKALWVSYIYIDLSQAVYVVYLAAIGHYWIALIQVVALVLQFFAQRPLYQNPTHTQYKKYLLTGNGLIAVVAFVSALSFGGYDPFRTW